VFELLFIDIVAVRKHGPIGIWIRIHLNPNHVYDFNTLWKNI
jgi:hypothetical protein